PRRAGVLPAGRRARRDPPVPGRRPARGLAEAGPAARDRPWAPLGRDAGGSAGPHPVLGAARWPWHGRAGHRPRSGRHRPDHPAAGLRHRPELRGRAARPGLRPHRPGRPGADVRASTDVGASAVSRPADPGRRDPRWSYEVVTVSFHSRGQLEQMIAGLPVETPVVVIDNAKGADRVWELIADRPNGRYLDSGGGKGFAKAANMGIRSSEYEYVILCNPDSRPNQEII